MKNPAVLWYPSDFISSTSFWNNEQCGAYIRLLNYQFVLGHLKIEQIKTITTDTDVLKKFVQDREGLYYNERMEMEIIKRFKYSESRSKNKIGKTKDMKIISKSYDNHMGNGNINDNINIYKDIISYLNIKTNSNYKNNSTKTKDLIKARLNEGFVLEDFKKVIDIKTKEWENDNKMVVFLRPETLFSNKFESYLNQKEKGKLTTKDLKIDISDF